jgi:hypothetical protein
MLGLSALVLIATAAAVRSRHPVLRSTAEPETPQPGAAASTPPPEVPQAVQAPPEEPAPAPVVRPARISRPAARRAPASIETSRAFDDRLSSESRLLDLARVALSEGDVHRSLAAIEQHRRTYPEGQLLPQREALRIEALIAAEDYSSALAAASSFQHRFPQSVLKLKIDRLIRGLPEEWKEE